MPTYYSIRKYVFLPIILGEIIYALLNIGFYNLGIRIHQEGLMFFTEIACFCLFTIIPLPYIIWRYYNRDLWEVIQISRGKWLWVISFTCLISIFFISSTSITIFQITINRSGFGVISFTSVIQAAIFEELLFRGVILNLNLQRLPKTSATRLNGILFGLWHVVAFIAYSPSFVLFLFIIISGFFGYGLSRIQIRYNNLLIPITIHSLALIILSISHIITLN